MIKNKILIIDDDADLLASTKLFLESKNFVVETAINSKIGLGVLKTFQPDLIILDIMMDSQLEGFNFLNELKSADRFKETPVIMSTGMAKSIGVNMRAAIEDINSLPKTKFIDKSGDWEELLEAIKELL
jgi:two-component system, NtrC family, response regulator GlrR